MIEEINILYVDDSEGDVELLELSLERYRLLPHLILDIARTVAEAKQKFSSKKYAAALVDWNLPDGEGVEVAQYIRSSNAELPIIFLSGVVTENQVIKVQEYNPEGCLEKGYDQEHIEAMLQLLKIKIMTSLS